MIIIVPYRNRKEHLDYFIPYIKKFVKQQAIKYKLYIVEQADKKFMEQRGLIQCGSKIIW